MEHTKSNCQFDEYYYNLKENLQDSIKSIIKKKGFVNFTVQTKNLCTDGGNYMGDLHQVDIKGQTEDGEDELNLFVKTQCNDGESTTIALNDVFLRELHFYKNIASVFDELQEEARIPLDERYKLAKMYKESSRHAIILENLSVKGYDVHHRLISPPMEFVEMSIKDLAKFHALSYAMESKRPDYYEANVKNLKYLIDLNGNEGLVKLSYSNLETVSECLDENTKRRLNKYFPILLVKSAKIFKTTSASSCLCFNDYRPNNILKKEVNGTLQDLVPVDYQLASYGVPAIDLVYFIYTTIGKTLRVSQLDRFKQLYYDSMKHFLEYFDLDVNTVYPRKVFEADYDFALIYGLYIGVMIGPVIWNSEEGVPSLHDANSKFILSDFAREFITDIVQEFVENGIL